MQPIRWIGLFINSWPEEIETTLSEIAKIAYLGLLDLVEPDEKDERRRAPGR